MNVCIVLNMSKSIVVFTPQNSPECTITIFSTEVVVSIVNVA